MKIFETHRLIVRQIQLDDFNGLYQMNSDPEFMKYVGNGTTRSLPQMEIELVRLTSNYIKRPGKGIWAMICRDTNKFIGAAGLVFFNNTQDIEIGYRILKQHWNKGYATEVSFGLLKHGFDMLGLTKIVASAHIENVASKRILEKIGMDFIGNRFAYGCLQSCFEIGIEKYKKAKNGSI